MTAGISMILGKAGADRAPLQQNKFKVMDTLQHNFIGDSPAMAKALQFAGKAARSRAPVLIQGESGTGKGILARVIHQNGPRRQHRCVAVNCATCWRNSAWVISRMRRKGKDVMRRRLGRRIDESLA